MKKKVLYSSFDHFVVRTSLFPFSSLENRQRIIDSQAFQEALFLASPDLFHTQVVDHNKEKREKRKMGIQKYLLRACTRCTPFGLFAGCSVGTIGEESCIELAPLDQYR